MKEWWFLNTKSFLCTGLIHFFQWLHFDCLELEEHTSKTTNFNLRTSKMYMNESQLVCLWSLKLEAEVILIVIHKGQSRFLTQVVLKWVTAQNVGVKQIYILDKWDA